MTEHSADDRERSGGLERFAIERALTAAWATEFWIPADPDYGFVDYFMAAATRILGLLRGFEELAADIDRRGILPQPDSDQAQLVTDGGQVEDGTERVEYLLELSQDRLANGCDDEIYNLALRDASAWWLTSTDKERAEKREKVFKRERLLTNVFLKTPQIGWYNDYLHKKLEKYEGWTEVFKSVEADQFQYSLRAGTSQEDSR